ncbi:tRNA/rRNA methyltransferase [Aeromonas sp. BIGb0405]|jgi:tRNA/rRNA methyltransferase|nr:MULTISPECIES: tRNA/rRNA methyltransferase [unclassified Aeromonas]MCS3454562.1 tRNA/rRNA methyltransferase [Aeromonas sp. BIGb0405]MCS3459491.1 tRNA/rRNA methyltransferase [Aeromonas sp. BIGb0445]
MKLYFVLMAPARPQNVGAAARAMKTMGFDAMRVVASRVHQEDEASWVAHGAQEILANAEAFDTLPDALADMDLVIATTARQRGRYQHYLTPGEIRDQIRAKPSLNKVAILFGCEESGLSNEQLAHADLLSYLPLKVSYPSLNLGQAIMLYAYELSPLLDESTAVDENSDNSGQVRVLKSKTAEILAEVGVSQDEKLHQWVMDRVPMLPQRDLNMLHLLCKDLMRRLGKLL